MKREILEVAGFVGLIGVYVGFNETLAGKAFFIIPAVIACGGYALYAVTASRSTRLEYGIRVDNIGRATKLTVLVLGPLAVALVGIAVARGAAAPPRSFYVALLIYPIWGIVQQFLFQSFLHTRLIRLGVTPWSVLIVAVLFAIVHPSSAGMFWITLVGGLAASAIFLKCPNIFPLGVGHGILAAFVYYLLFGKDPLATFLT